MIKSGENIFQYLNNFWDGGGFSKDGPKAESARKRIKN
jgi:hypothetical protein